MQSKRTVILWLLMVFLLINSSPLAQEGRKPDDRKKATRPPSLFEKKERPIPTEERLLGGIDAVLKRGDTYIAREEMYWALEKIQEYAEVVNSQKMADKIMAIPEYELWNRDHPEHAYGILAMKLIVLSFFKEYTGVREYVIKHLDHKSTSVQVVAARTLLWWGEWDIGAPVICRNEAYRVFQQCKDKTFIKKPTEQKIASEKERIDMLQKEITDFEALGRPPGRISRLLSILYGSGKTLETLENPDNLAQVILDFPNDFHDEIIAAKIQILTPHRTHPGVYEFVCEVSKIEETNIQRAAAVAFLEWGEWEKAVPLFSKSESYWILCQFARRDQMYKKEAVPLFQGAIAHASWQGRINAALGLKCYGDSTTIREVALDILVNSPLTDDMNVRRAQYLALEEARELDISNIPAIARLANSPDTGTRIWAVDLLGYFLLYTDNEPARLALEKIAAENEDLSLRATAEYKLSLENSRKDD